MRKYLKDKVSDDISDEPCNFLSLKRARKFRYSKVCRLKKIMRFSNRSHKAFTVKSRYRFANGYWDLWDRMFNR